MTVLALSGIRGGVGTTSLAAGLGFALQTMGQRVLLLDLCPRDLLRLHCNLPLESVEGWARSERAGEGSWSDALLQVVGELYLLPHGRPETGAPADVSWAQRLQQLQRRFDWVLLDLPPEVPGVTLAAPDLGDGVGRLRVIEADAACHAVLHIEGAGEAPLLINRFDPLSQLQRDLLLLWRERLEGRLVPQVVHRDEAMAGALAWKSPLGYYAGDSLAAQDVRSLATWCMAQWGAQR
ncbi:cellulose biosynthesis protein BcsQ [Pseudomonas knackmussii]|uniref:cellulose biosynthesis protein BcsQ n=1 Tax=Pseudomonas knackmussii TaxID=65741 RepID=UPI003F4A3940